MCGVSGLFGPRVDAERLRAMVASQRHRGPDASGIYVDDSAGAGLGHNRLSILDLTAEANQPMESRDGRYVIVYNGEIYNYLELRELLGDYPYRSRSDTEVILAAWQRWGEGCLDHFIGMFAFLIWDTKEKSLFGARDRFGVKPFYYYSGAGGSLAVASEIKALHAAGVQREMDLVTWATYLTSGLYDHSERTFWKDIRSLRAGHKLHWRAGKLRVSKWYDLADRVGDEQDGRSSEEVLREYSRILDESVRFRFRSDVPVGINISGGLDSSVLLAMVNSVQGAESSVKAYTYVTGDPNYDELPWVSQMLSYTKHESVVPLLESHSVPERFQDILSFEDEPFGGMPTLAYATVFERAQRDGTTVLLDGQGMDEQWAGYDYYRTSKGTGSVPIVQGTREPPVRPNCLTPEFRALAEPAEFVKPYPDQLRNTQYRDITYTKIPRALRFNDRISMRYSTELREPFLDHRLLELAFRQPDHRKIVNGTHKWLLRRLARQLVPHALVEAPKRPLQTPQREWLRGPLSDWATDLITSAVHVRPEWLVESEVRRSWRHFQQGRSDNSCYVWQWISLGALAPALSSSAAWPVQRRAAVAWART